MFVQNKLQCQYFVIFCHKQLGKKTLKQLWQLRLVTWQLTFAKQNKLKNYNIDYPYYSHNHKNYRLSSNQIQFQKWQSKVQSSMMRWCIRSWIQWFCKQFKGGSFQKVWFFFSNLQKNIFQKTILSLKFKFPANKTLLILAGNLNFKLRIVFWNIFFGDLEVWKTNRTFWK